MAFFHDRVDAGRKLAERLASYKAEKPVILAIPRGGVIVAAEIAKALNATMTLVIPRKIGAPYNPEYAIGAVAEDGSMILDETSVEALGIPGEYIEREKNAQIEEIKRRKKEYGAKDIDLKGRAALIVDDGIATGSTILAAAQSVRKSGAKKIVVAIPVAPPEALEALKPHVDAIVCLHSPRDFGAVGRFYEDFSQTTDDEVKVIIADFS